jgi:hypothetical protein
MTLIGECKQDQEDDDSFFQPPHFIEVLKGKTIER